MDDSTVQVTTVGGPVPVDALGMTLTHEHLLSDWSARRRDEPDDPAERALFHTPVGPSMQWLLREDPRCCLDNTRQDDPDATVAELANFVAVGGRTVVDCTNGDVGRDPGALRDIAQRTGLNVVMGSGWYVHAFHPARRAHTTVDDLVVEILAEFSDGVGDTGIRPGIIGEIGVSPLFTEAERTHLRASARAQRELGVPLYVHLPGWQRRAHEVLDIVLDEEGVRPEGVVLCHMDPSGEDRDYQRAVAERGVWLEFDMIGMPFFYAGEGQSPAPEQTAAAVAALFRDGHAERILLSHDMASKAMWTRNGGNGFGYVPRFFLPRLERHGVPGEVTASLLTTNPRRLFTAACGAHADH
ncbi:phosphotriesterase [Pseudonocardia xishanensis]|uniref:Phosphotriesterase n=1 Tax=Pseudonocardia xishanensis TaxID=630995 RepID=A0ABP8S2V3_9PSEU